MKMTVKILVILAAFLAFSVSTAFAQDNNREACLQKANETIAVILIFLVANSQVQNKPILTDYNSLSML